MRTYAAFIAYAEGQVTHPTQDWSNLCQMFSRTCAGAGAWAASARLAFNAVPAAHKHTSWPPPAGSIAYWGNDHSGNGHATPVGVGVLYSNDIYRHGKIDRVKLTAEPSEMPFAKVKGGWGLPYRGWIDETPSGALNLKPVAPTAAPYPGTPIGWPSAATTSAGPAITTLEECFGLPKTGRFSKALRDKIAQHQTGHAWAWTRDRVGRGAAGPNLYASILKVYYPGA